MEQLEVAPDDLEIVSGILRRHVPEFEVRAFGSRVRGKARPTSDLDLVVMTHDPLPLVRLAALRVAFRESDLPYKVDVTDWAATPPGFRAIIDEVCVVVQRARGKRPD